MSAASPWHLQKSVLARRNYKVLYRGVIMDARQGADKKETPGRTVGTGDREGSPLLYDDT